MEVSIFTKTKILYFQKIKAKPTRVRFYETKGIIHTKCVLQDHTVEG